MAIVNQGSVTGAIPGVIKQEKNKRTPQQKCEEGGGFWDVQSQTCLRVPPKEQPEADKKYADLKTGKVTTGMPTPAPKGALETFTSSETGRASGITTPGGKTYLGLSPDEVQKIATGEQERAARPLGTAPVGTAATQQRQAQLLQEQAGQIGQLQPEAWAPVQQAPIDWGQALTAGASNVPSIVSRTAAGAAGGAVAGGALGLGIGAVPGAVVGGIGGFISAVWSGTASNIKSQQRGEIGASQDVLTNARTNMRQLAMLASQDPANAAEYIQAYNAQLSMVYKAQRQIKAETAGNLNKFMEDGRDILSDFELFLGPDGTAEIYGSKLRIALTSGVPMPLTEGDLPE